VGTYGGNHAVRNIVKFNEDAQRVEILNKHTTHKIQDKRSVKKYMYIYIYICVCAYTSVLYNLARLAYSAYRYLQTRQTNALNYKNNRLSLNLLHEQHYF